MSARLTLRLPGLVEFADSYREMSAFTSRRNDESADEIWCLQHPPVYTLGLAGKREHILDAGEIPVLPTDRGGQVTYHGPGQLVVYLLLDLRRRKLAIKDYVYLLEQSIIDYLAGQAIAAARVAGAPGVYVEERKIAALGIRVRRGCCYHGLALNVDMDTGPFEGINPCGYPHLQVAQLADFCVAPGLDAVSDELVQILIGNLYGEHCIVSTKDNLDDLAAENVV